MIRFLLFVCFLIAPRLDPFKNVLFKYIYTFFFAYLYLPLLLFILGEIIGENYQNRSAANNVQHYYKELSFCWKRGIIYIFFIQIHFINCDIITVTEINYLGFGV